MKINNLILSCFVIGLSACTQDDISIPTATFSPDTTNCKILTNDTILCEVGAEITFKHKGDCDYITFWSGEQGNTYENKDRVNIPVDSAYLEFNSYSAYGNTAQPRPLSVYISDSFMGKYSWVGIYDINVKWDTITPVNTPNYNTTFDPFPSGRIDISKYNEKPFYVAFKAVSDSLSGTTRMVRVSDFYVKSYTTIGLTTIANISTGGFTAVNIMGTSVWTNTSTALNFRGTAQVKEEDWIISKELELGRVDADKGVSIKTLTQNMDDFNYVYTEAGTFSVTIEVINSRYGKLKSQIQHFTVVVK